MQQSRREFFKKSAVVVGATAVGATAVVAIRSSDSSEEGSNGVLYGDSPKKEILYKKTAAWEAFYTQAK